MATLTQIKQRFWDNDGTLLSGGKVYIYLAGTSTLTNSYTDATGLVANTNPVILDAKGEASIWTNGLVKINVLNSADVQVTGYPVDNVGPAEYFGSDGTATISAITTITSGYLNKVTTLSGTTYTVTLPAANTVQDGSKLEFKCTASGNITITRASTDTIGMSSATVTSMIMKNGDTLTLVSNGSNQWVLLNPFLQNDTVDAEIFGAKGDGVTDDTTALNLAKVTNKVVMLENGKTYAISSQIAATADNQGFMCNGKATILMLSGTGEFDRADYTGTQFDTDACGIYCNGYDNFTLKGVHIKFETIAAVRTAKAFAIRDSMGSNVDIECSLFQETEDGIVTVDSCGQNCNINAYVHDCGTSDNTLATMQITAIDVDNNMIGSVSTTHSKINLVAKNITMTGAALTKYGEQTDGVNIGTGNKNGLQVNVDAENVSEPFDCFGSFVKAAVNGKTCRATGIKLIHGAQSCNIDAVIDGTNGAAVLIYGSDTASQNTSHNKVNCVASNVGLLSGALAKVGVNIDGDLTYKPTENYVSIVLNDTGNMTSAAIIIAGSNNVVEYATDSVQTTSRPAYIASPATTGNRIINIKSNYGDYVASRKYGGQLLNLSSTTALTLSANTLYAIPLIVTQAQTFTTCTVRISTGVAGNMRLGLYNWEGGIPTSLILDFGTISTAATGEIDLSISGGAGVSLPPGVYALALVTDVAPAVYSTSANVQLMSIVGIATLGTADCQISRAFTYAALPATWGTPTYGTGTIPNVILRF